MKTKRKGRATIHGQGRGSIRGIFQDPNTGGLFTFARNGKRVTVHREAETGKVFTVSKKLGREVKDYKTPPPQGWAIVAWDPAFHKGRKGVKVINVTEKGMTKQTNKENDTTGQVWEGTWENISLHATELSGRRLRVVALDEDTEREPAPKRERVTARGKYAGVLSTQDVIRAKQEDIALEDRRR